MIAFLVAGTASGVGKTTVALSLMSAFYQKKLVVQAFKCGPDFLDTGHHSRICNRHSRNLDSWMLSHDTNRELYAKAVCDADVAIVEGVMGLFDGVSGGSEQGSAAEIAKLLNIPIVLVVDASRSGRSIAAVVKGFLTFDPSLRFAGVILNQVAGENHFRLLETAIRATCDVPILGWLPKEPSICIPERHLGLHTAEEFDGWQQRREELAGFALKHINLDLLARSASCSRPKLPENRSVRISKPKVVRIGVAQDQSFSFYYQDNLDCLREMGAEIVPFSPLTDSNLPPNLSALYLGGGYPELYAEALANNSSMLSAFRYFAAEGYPIYGECGGMMYLAESLKTLDGKCFRLAGVLPLQVEMTDRLMRFGYAQLELTEDCILGRKGTITRGHSFHYSRCSATKEVSSVYRVSYTLSGKQESEGYRNSGVLGSYLHLHFLSNPSIAESFVEHARRFA